MKIVFVKRPRFHRRYGHVIDALRATAKNGKALQVPYRLTGHYARALRHERLIMRTARRGKFILAWCENGTKKKGGR